MVDEHIGWWAWWSISMMVNEHNGQWAWWSMSMMIDVQNGQCAQWANRLQNLFVDWTLCWIDTIVMLLASIYPQWISTDGCWGLTISHILVQNMVLHVAHVQITDFAIRIMTHSLLSQQGQIQTGTANFNVMGHAAGMGGSGAVLRNPRV